MTIMVHDQSVVQRVRDVVFTDGAIIQLNDGTLKIQPVNPVARLRLIRKFREADINIRWDHHCGYLHGRHLEPFRTAEGPHLSV